MSNTKTVWLWLSNEEPSYRHIEAMAKECLEQACENESHATTARNEAVERLAEIIEELVREGMPIAKGMWGELLNSTLQSVDFEDLARDWLADFKIYSVISSDDEDAQLFTDMDLARGCLLENVDPESDPDGAKACRIQDMQPGSKVSIEGTEYTLGVS